MDARNVNKEQPHDVLYASINCIMHRETRPFIVMQHSWAENAEIGWLAACLRTNFPSPSHNSRVRREIESLQESIAFNRKRLANDIQDKREWEHDFWLPLRKSISSCPSPKSHPIDSPFLSQFCHESPYFAIDTVKRSNRNAKQPMNSINEQLTYWYRETCKSNSLLLSHRSFS